MRGTTKLMGYIRNVVRLSCATSTRTTRHGLATVVDSMRESIHDLRCNFLCLQEWADAVEVSLCQFSRHNSRLLRKSPNWKASQCSAELIGTALFVVSLHVVAENVVTDRQTDRQTNGPSTVTLAAQARRGWQYTNYWCLYYCEPIEELNFFTCASIVWKLWHLMMLNITDVHSREFARFWGGKLGSPWSANLCTPMCLNTIMYRWNHNLSIWWTGFISMQHRSELL